MKRKSIEMLNKANRTMVLTLSLLILSAGCRQEPESWVAVKDVRVAGKPNHVVLAVNLLTNEATQGQAVVYDLYTKKKLHAFGEYRDWLSSVDISNDGKLVVTGSYDKGVEVFEIGEEARKKNGFGRTGGRVLCVCMSPDGKQAASGDWDGSLVIWDVASGKRVATVPGLGDSVDAIEFSSDGKFLAATADGKITLVNAKDLKLVKTIPGHSPYQTNGLAFSPDTKLLATSSLDKSVRIWDAQTLKELENYKTEDSVDGLVFSKDGNSLICGAEEKQLLIWNFRKKSDPVVKLAGHENAVYAVDISSDGKQIISCGHDQTARIWNLKSAKLELTIHPSVNFGNEK